MSRRLPPDASDASAPSALGAFVRGVERRGLVFAWLLAGSREAGAASLDWAVDRFRAEAARTPFGDWPRRFWSLLLAAPPLRRPPAEPRWPPGFDWLSRIGHGPRAALLLRLVGGLAESDAASVLGVARPTYRIGLQRALPHRADGSADVEAWHALGLATQELVRVLPSEPLPAATDAAAEPRHAAAPPADGPRAASRGLRVALAVVALATLGALAATFVSLDRLPAGLEAAPDAILVEPLPGDVLAPAPSPEATALELHPDLALLLDAAAEGEVAADPAFYAWLLAVGEVEDAVAAAGDADPATPAILEPIDLFPAADARGVEAEAAARRPAGERLEALDAPARAQLEQRREAWDALPPAERGEHRERWQAWRDLRAAERAGLRAAAARHAQRTPDAQAALRARFDALDASERHGWLLGPDLGIDYPRLHPLFAQVPGEARPALLEALHGLDAQARDDLAVLAVRVPPQERAALRVELLATPPDQRAQWLRRRVSPPVDVR